MTKPHDQDRSLPPAVEAAIQAKRAMAATIRGDWEWMLPETAVRELLALAAEQARQAAQNCIDGILRDYADELDKAACDRCENCGPVGMCGFHSVLSIVAGHSLPTPVSPDVPMPLPPEQARQAEWEAQWQPIATAPKDDTVILRPHRIWGAMDVRRISEADAERVSVLSRDIPWAWLNGDYTTAWTESAFLPFWMPRPPAPDGTQEG